MVSKKYKRHWECFGHWYFKKGSWYWHCKDCKRGVGCRVIRR